MRSLAIRLRISRNIPIQDQLRYQQFRFRSAYQTQISRCDSLQHCKRTVGRMFSCAVFKASASEIVVAHEVLKQFGIVNPMPVKTQPGCQMNQI